MKKVWYVAQLSKYTFHQSNVNRSPDISANRRPAIFAITGFSLPLGEFTLSVLDSLHAGLSEMYALPPTKVLTCSLFCSSERPFSEEGSPMSMVSSFSLPPYIAIKGM